VSVVCDKDHFFGLNPLIGYENPLMSDPGIFDHEDNLVSLAALIGDENRFISLIFVINKIDKWHLSHSPISHMTGPIQVLRT
jgi:hypothetical protein